MALPRLDLTDLAPLDLASEFRAARTRVIELVRGLSSEDLDRRVPATPEWTIRDVVAHQAGSSADVVAGNIEGAPEEAWTRAQVAARRGRAIRDLLDEWETNATRVEPLMASAPEPFTFMVVDTVSHENDLLATLGRPVRRDDPILSHLAARLARVIGPKVDRAGLPALEIRAGANEWVAGNEARGASVRAPDEFELTRAGVGRRSVDQMRAWEWDGDPDAYIPLLSLFEPRATPLVE